MLDKKTSILLLVTFIFSGCSLKKDVLRSGDSKGFIKVDDENGTPTSFFIVEPIQLLKARKPRTLTYMGSKEEYHLFCVWSKIKPSEDEIHFFAVARDQCLVEHERTIVEEYKACHKPPITYRIVEINDGKCKVKEKRKSIN